MIKWALCEATYQIECAALRTLLTLFYYPLGLPSLRDCGYFMVSPLVRFTAFAAARQRGVRPTRDGRPPSPLIPFDHLICRNSCPVNTDKVFTQWVECQRRRLERATDSMVSEVHILYYTSMVHAEEGSERLSKAAIYLLSSVSAVFVFSSVRLFGLLFLLFVRPSSPLDW